MYIVEYKTLISKTKLRLDTNHWLFLKSMMIWSTMRHQMGKQNDSCLNLLTGFGFGICFGLSDDRSDPWTKLLIFIEIGNINFWWNSWSRSETFVVSSFGCKFVITCSRSIDECDDNPRYKEALIQKYTQTKTKKIA